MPRILGAFVVFCIVSGMLFFMVLASVPKHETSAAAPASAGIQSKARVFDLAERDGFTKVGIMAAYEPTSRAFWWRPTPMIAEPNMLERYFERCKFQMDGTRLLNFCVRGNEVVVTGTNDYAQSLEQGLSDAQSRLQVQPDLVMTYHGPRDVGIDLKQKAGVDTNTGEGVPPTVVRSVRKTDAGWELDVTCGCGNSLITLNNNFEFAGFKRN